MSLAATAADPGGTIARVEFWQGATLINSDTTAPYAFDWVNVQARSYTLTAKAIDNQGNATASAPVAITVTAQTALYFIHADHLNTPRALVDAQGRTVWKWENADPFGNNAPDEDPDADTQRVEFNLRFPGQYYDKETGLHYNYFRDYDPGIGRYVESDPIGLAGGINTYSYGYNPITQIDPLGLMGRGSGVSNSKGTTNRLPKDSSCGPCKMRLPDYIQFSLDIYVFNLSGSYSRSGNSFLGGGPTRQFPSSVDVGVSISGGWLNQCAKPTAQEVDDFLGGYGLGVAGFYPLVGGGLSWSPGSGTATNIGVGAGFSVNPLGASVKQGATGLGGW